MGSAVCCMVSARGLAARVAPACTGPVLCAHTGAPHSLRGPGPGCSPTAPTLEGEVLALQKTFYKAPSSIGFYCKNKNRPGSLPRRQRPRVLNFKLLLCQDAALTLKAPGDPEGRLWRHHCGRAPFRELVGAEQTSDKCLLGGRLEEEEEERRVCTREQEGAFLGVPDTRLWRPRLRPWREGFSEDCLG